MPKNVWKISVVSWAREKNVGKLGIFLMTFNKISAAHVFESMAGVWAYNSCIVKNKLLKQQCFNFVAFINKLFFFDKLFQTDIPETKWKTIVMKITNDIG